MFRRYSFLILFLGLLSTLTWWSGTIESSSGPAPAPKAGVETAQRRELLENLDRLVAYEHYYRSVYGHFTRLESRLGFAVSPGLRNFYEVRVTEATRDRLRVTALSEMDGQPQDFASIDQDFRIQASFPLPGPRPEYLRLSALKHLRLLRDSTGDEPVVEEQGLYRGFFRYEVRKDPQGRKLAFAVGMKAPVVGIQLQLAEGDETLADTAAPGEEVGAEIAALSEGGTGERSSAMSTLEEAYLAQRIFRGEVGRYARSWSELSKIASFRFQNRELYGQPGQVPFGDSGPVLEIDAASPDKDNQTMARIPSSEAKPLEIEAVY